MKFSEQALFVIIFFVCAFDLSLGRDLDESGTIIFANILFRHGDRTPINPYPTDPYRNESLWPVPFGQLTNLGKEEHLILGKWFRNRYNHLLSNLYSMYDIYIRSTDVDRTLMSAEANLAGLYPPEGNQIWDNLKWMPIPVHTTPEIEDNLLAGKKNCPRYDYELENVLSSAEFTGIMKKNQQLLDYLSEMSGKKIDSLLELEFLYDTLKIESANNMTLPEWTKSVYPNKMKHLADFSFTIHAYNKILQRLRIGNLVGDMKNHMVAKSLGRLVPDRKVWVYSAHDDTIANFLMALNLFEIHSPPYAAAVLLELRRNSKNEDFVTISYKNSSSEPTLLTLPGCLPFCPLAEFIRLTLDVIPEDWDRECLIGVQKHGLKIDTTNFSAFISTLGILLLVTLSVVCLAFWYAKYRGSQYYLPLNTK